MSENGRRLTSWKEIAAHLGRDVRTVLRWEKDRGLPVHRVPGATGRVVFAYTDELDAWARGELARTPPAEAAPTEPGARSGTGAPVWRWRLAAAIAAGCGIVAIMAAALWVSRGRSRSTDIAQLNMTDTMARAVNAEGQELWSFTFPQPAPLNSRLAAVGDLNGDGRPDAVISLVTFETGNNGAGLLIALDHLGRVMWRRSVDDRVTFGAGPFVGPWAPDELLVYQSGGQSLVAWALHHHTWWPSLVAVFDGKGDRRSTFVNSGWIRSLSLSNDGRYLLAGGISNAREGAAFAVLDAQQPSGASPEDPGTPFACKGCPRGAPVRYYVMPWSDIINPTLLDGRRGTFNSFSDGSFELRGVQQQNGEMLVDLSPAFEIKRRSVSDGFWNWHRKFEREGLLTHTGDTCPFRNGPPLLEWSPEQGWRDVPR